jgi:hypothetical protein
MAGHISEAGDRKHTQYRGMAMKTSLRKYVGAIGLAGALALMGAASSFAQVGAGEGGGYGYPHQYCVPQDESAGVRQPLYC